MLIQQGSTPVVFVWGNEFGAAYSAFFVRADGSTFAPITPAVLFSGTASALFSLTLSINDTNQLGQAIAIVTNTVMGNVIGATPYEVVSFDPTGQNYATGGADPWTTPLPGAYAAGEAGYILGTNLNTPVSTLSTYAGGPVASVTGDVGGNLVGNVLGTLPEVVLAASQPHWSLGATLPRGVALAGLQFEMYGLTSPSEPLTGLTVSGAISKDGGAFAPCTNAPVPLTNGTYAIDLTAAELTCKVGKLRLTAAGADTTYISLLTSS